MRDKTLFSKGNEALRNGNYHEAIRCYQKALVATPVLERAIRANIQIAQMRLASAGNWAASSFENRFDGRVEVVNNGRVSGWAIDRAMSFDGPLIVELLLNGVVYQSRPASIQRDDVEKKYPGHLNSGFQFSVPLDSFPQKTIQVEVRIAGTDFVLPSKAGVYKTVAPEKPRVQDALRWGTPNPKKNVTIIIPVFNAPDELESCLESVFRYTNFECGAYRLILSDDASPDSRVRDILERYSKNKWVLINRNEKNCGYTINVNKAISLSADTDIVLLNSDTRVTPQWLELLQRSAYSSPFIGTVSPLSDNAGAFSVPVRNSSNVVPAWLSQEEYARLVTQISRFSNPRVPTTSGFCMYIKREVLASIGLFDEANFPKGYGEENDFCMRAGHVGWEHVVADNVLVYHSRSASFKESKKKLMEHADNTIPKMYPEYPAAVGQAFVANQEFAQIRFNIAYEQLRYKQAPRPRVAYVIGVETGGTPQTNMDLMSAVQEQYEPYLLLCTTRLIRVYKIYGKERVELEKISLRHPVMPIAHDSDSYQREILDILQRYAFELVHIRHIGRHGLSLIRMARLLNIRVIFSLHDFYTVCPNVKLLDADNKFCGGVCTKGEKDCNVELWDQRHTPVLKNGWVHSWRKMFQSLLPLCDMLITTSPYARDLIRSVYKIDNVRFEIVPHARDFERFISIDPVLEEKGKLKVFVPGHIVPAKGLDLIKEVKALDVSDEIEFHFAGVTKEDLSQFGVVHGPYNREEFSALVEKIRPHIGGVFSIWPETYSHTLTELWSCGLPVVTSSYGATGERMAYHGGGWVVDQMTAKSLFDLLLYIKNNPSTMAEQRAKVLQWQSGYGAYYRVPLMAAQYKRLYSQVLDSNPNGKQLEAIAVAFGAVPDDTPVAVHHIEELIRSAYGDCRVMAWPQSALCIWGQYSFPDFLVLRYHSESDHEEFFSALKRIVEAAETKLVIDISIDALHSVDQGDFVGTRPQLAWLLKHANKVIVPPGSITSLKKMFGDIDVMKMAPRINEKQIPEITAVWRSPIQGLAGELEEYADHIKERVRKEICAEAADCIYSHNAPYVIANFTLIDWSALLSRPRVGGMVSIIIPSFNKVGITEKFVRTILTVTKTETPYEIIIVDNGSIPDVRVQVLEFERKYSNVRVVCANMPLMFSVGCNYGASFARGEYLLFLNNDMLAIEPNWLDALIAPLVENEHVGVVGGKLLYQDRKVQHAGLVFSDSSHLAYHVYLGESEHAPHVNKAREMQAVTGACLGIRASDFGKLRGFNPLYMNGCEDVDLCLRVINVLRRKVVYTPNSVLIHLEGKSPGRGKFVLANRLIFSELWGDKIKPDDYSIYLADGFARPQYTTNDDWMLPQYRALKVNIH